MRRLKLVMIIVVAVLLIVLVLQNTEVLPVQFLFYTFHVPKTALFLVLLLAGFVIGALAGQRIRGRSKHRK